MQFQIPSSKISFGTFLDRGGFGTVYKGTYAKDSNSQSLEVALKVLNISPSSTAGGSIPLESFKKEISILENVSAQCEHVCRFHGVTNHKGTPALVMKFYPQSLAAELQSASGHRLSLGVLLRRAADICSGLQEVHAMSIIVRDLKPANVLVAENGTAVLADFGLARVVVSKHSTTNTRVGTKDYMSPEMWDADLGDTTSKADIWALACTIVEMGTGHVYPEQQSTDSMIMNRLLGKQRGPDIPSSFPSDLQRLLQRCFAFNPKERPSAKEVLQLLGQISTGSKSGSTSQIQVKADAMAGVYSSLGAKAAPTQQPKVNQHPKVKQQPIEAFRQATVEQLELETNHHWPLELVSTMSGLSSDEADTVVHYGLDKESKYRVCAGLLGQLWRASTDGKMAPLTETTQKEVSKELVQGPVIGYVLTTSVSTPHGPSQPHMAYVFRLAMCYCSYGTLSNWSVSAGNMRIVVQSLEGALKEYRKSRPGFLGSCPTIPGTDITVYSVMHEVCENLLRGARHLILEKGTWDDSYNRKNMFSYSAGFDMCINYFKNGTTELRLAAMNLLDAVIATPSSNSFSERLSALRSTAEIQGILTKLVKSPDESDSTQADARRVLALL